MVTESYKSMKTRCIERQCFVIDSKMKLERDMCVHKCMDESCFQRTYGDILIRMPYYKFKKEEERDRQSRMNKFKSCIQIKLNLTENQEDEK